MILIFDTETSGLPKNWSASLKDGDNWPRLVQLSWIIIKDNNESKEFDFIIKPEGFSIPEEVSKIHGITNEIAMDEGISLKAVLSIFREYFEKSKTIVAHNIDFDKSIVGAEFWRIGSGAIFEEAYESKEKFCTMKKSTDLLKLKGTHAGGNKWPRLMELHEFLFNEKFDGAHNSLMDTRACARCYKTLIQKKDELEQIKRW